MPEKLPSDFRDLSFDLTDAALARPILAAEAGRMFALWANVEMLIALLLSTLVDEEEALRTVDSLRSKNARNKEIKRLAKNKINDPNTLKLFEDVTDFVVNSAQPRNKLAHWQWGTHSSFPDALMLINPSASLRFGRALFFGSANRFSESEGIKKTKFEASGPLVPEQVIALIDEIRENTEVWRRRDFDLPIDNLNRSIILLTSMCNMFAAEEHSESAANAERQVQAMLRKYSAPQT